MMHSSQTLYVMGVASGVGKSTITLGLIGALLHEGISPTDIAYIKPMTQCIDAQLVSRYCHQVQVEHHGIGPIVFGPGFTRNFIKGETATTTELRHQAIREIQRLSEDHQIVLIDGVGYASVGTVIGVSNADLASALGAPVLFVGRPGVGDGIDSAALAIEYIKSRGAHPLGLIFNKLTAQELGDVPNFVTPRMAELYPQLSVYGYLPRIPELETIDQLAIEDDQVLELAEAVVSGFRQHINTPALLKALHLDRGEEAAALADASVAPLS